MKKIFILLFLSITFVSCKKSNTNITASKELLVSSATNISYGSNGPDTIITTYQYDSNNRLVKQIDNQTTISTYEYDVNGNLINRTINFGQGVEETYNIFYQNNQPSYATHVKTINSTGVSTQTYSYTVANNKIVEIEMPYAKGNPNNELYKISYENNDVISVTTEIYGDSTKINYSYGNKKSPYSTSYLKWYLFTDVYIASQVNHPYPTIIYSENDPVSSLVEGQANTSQYNITYNQFNYPTQITTGPSESVTYTYVNVK